MGSKAGAILNIGIQAAVAAFAVAAAITSPAWGTIALAAMFTYSLARTIFTHPAALPSNLEGFSVTETHSDSQQPLAIPYGVTGAPGTLEAGKYPLNQPAVGINIVARTISGTSKNPKRYYWVLGAVCQGAVRSVEYVYVDGLPALKRVSSGSLGDRFVSVKASAAPADGPFDYRGVAAGWFAVGTAGQGALVNNTRAAGIYTVTASTQTGHNTRRLTIGAHGFVMGDCIKVIGVTGLDNTVAQYIITEIGGTTVTVWDPEGAGGGSGGGGTVQLYSPQLSSLFSTQLDAYAMGKGVCYVLIRLTQDDVHFADGHEPVISVGTSGIAAIDPRTSSTLTITTVDDAGAGGEWSHTVGVTFSGAHGMAEGDIFLVAGTGTRLDGVQRADRILSSTRVQVFCTAVNPRDSAIGTVHTGTARTMVATSNPIVAMRDYLINSIYGCGAAEAEIDDTAFNAAANYCDALVSSPFYDTSTFTNTRSITSTANAGSGRTDIVIGDSTGYTAGQVVWVQDALAPGLDGLRTIFSVPNGTTIRVTFTTAAGFGAGGSVQLQANQKRFQIAGLLSTSDTLKTNLMALAFCCRAALTYMEGKYTVSIRQPGVEVLTLTPDDIVGNWAFHLPGQQEMINEITATFPDPSRGYQLNTAYWPPSGQNGFLTTDNNQLNSRAIHLPLIDNLARAWQIMMVLRRETRVARTVNVTCRERALQLAVGDLVGVTHETPGWTNQLHWVAAVTPRTDVPLVDLLLEGYDATCYDLEATDDVKFAPITSLVPALPVDPPTSVTTDGYLTRRTITVSWVASITSGVVHYEAQYMGSESGADWQGAFTVDADALSGDITDLDAALSYDIRVRAIHWSGSHSDWVTLSSIVLDLQPDRPHLAAIVNSALSVTVIVDVDESTTAIKIVGSTASVPDLATVLAASPIAVTPGTNRATVAALFTLSPSAMGYVSCVALNSAGTHSLLSSIAVTPTTSTVLANPQGTVAIDADGNWEATVDGPGNCGSFRYSTSTSGYPADATVTSSGTIVNGRTFSTTGGPLTLGDTVYITIVPFTGSSGAGSAFPAIHIRGAYLTYTATKTATYSATDWAERSPYVQYGLDWAATNYAQNPALPTAGAPFGILYAWIFPVLPSGVTLVQGSIIASWATAATSLGAFSLGIYKNNILNGTGFVTYAGGTQTINISLSGTLASGTAVQALSIWNGPAFVGPDANARQASIRDLAITYTSPDSKKTL